MHSLDDRELLTAYATQSSEEAFAILVERHVSLVYSSVLRQVRDPHLAEEVTQAVFALLAQKAGSLRREAVLAGWLCRAARLTARNWIRTERRRRQREQEAYMNSPADSEPDPWPEIMPLLDEAVADLRKADRDVLVLRFYQRKPFEEIGRTLGLKVDAAEKRVTRALDKLRGFFAARGVVLTATAIATAISANAVQAAPAGLAVSVSSAAAKGTLLAAGFGFGAKIGGALGKVAASAAAIPFLGSLLSMCVVSLIVRAERRNFRDQEGFRSKLYGGYLCSFFWGYPLLLLVFLGTSGCLAMRFGAEPLEDGLAVFCALMVLLSARSLKFARSPRHVALFFYGLIISVAVWLRAFGWIDQGVFSLLFWLAFVLQWWWLKDRPIRMDFSLILRAAQGMLRHQESTGVSLPSFDRKSAMRFACFLGSRHLIANYAWSANGLLLRLAPVKARFLASMVGWLLPGIYAGHSTVLLRKDGKVVAHCSQRDAADLAQFQRPVDATELQGRVAVAVGNAWRSHQEGELAQAEAQIGELPESEVFVVSPTRSKSLRYYQAFFGVLIVIGLGLSILMFSPPESWSGFVPCQTTEAQVRAFLSQPRTKVKSSQSPPNSTVSALFMCLALPSTNLFTPEALHAMQNEVAGTGGFAFIRGPSKAADWVFGAFWHGRAVNIGWITWADLGVTSTDVAAELQANPERLQQEMKPVQVFQHRGVSTTLEGKETDILRAGFFTLAPLKILKDLDCLDLLNREELIAEIVPAQVPSSRHPQSPRRANWRAGRGLFHTLGWPALQDTYFALQALEILGGLDRIDREACVKAILRRHKGRGRFTSPEPGGYNEFRIDAGARDTIAAYECLRILGALDRVKDLDQWEFRSPKRRAGAEPAQPVIWEDVEAWVCQRRLQRILESKKRDPQEPYGSLIVSDVY